MVSAPARQLAERVYADEAAGAATSEEAIAAVERVHRKLAIAISPILGKAGVAAMASRAVQKAKAAHPRLEGVAGEGGDALLGAPLARLKGEDPAVVRSVGEALLGEFLELLSTFIGGDLATRLFLSTWPEAVADAIDPAEKP